MYAGPLPLIAVTASWCFSATCTTRPHERSSSAASSRWATSALRPGLTAAMPWSTSAGVLGMTRTTATPAGSRASSHAVGMPAARLTTRLPGESWSLISSTSRAMSCGLTTSTHVSAARAASTLDRARTPYRSTRSAARSGRRAVTTRSSTLRPERTSPDSNVSPMTPAPRIATVPMGEVCQPVAVPGSSVLGGETAQEEHGVGGTLGHAAHEVAVPLLAVGDVDTHLVAPVGDALLLLGPDAVQHLVLVAVGVAAVVVGEGGGD